MAYKSDFFDPFGDLEKSKKRNLTTTPYDDTPEENGEKDENGDATERKECDDGDCRTPSSSPDHNEEMDDHHWSSAPPIDMLDSIKGYEMVSFDSTMVPPPLQPTEPCQPDGEDKKEDDKEKLPASDKLPEIDPKLSEEQVRSALLTHIAASHCCYGKAAAKNMRVKKMEFLAAYHYELQTFSEKRETAWTYAAIRSGYAAAGGDAAMTNSAGAIPPPLPWEIIEEPTRAFKDEVKMVQVPHTGSTKTCHRCRGTGGMTCRDCNGKGWTRCLNCHGDGWLQHDSGGYKERCFYCNHSSKHGHGQLDCVKCGTKGKVSCATCDGHGQIHCFIQLSITWKVHTAEHIVKSLDLPQDLVRDVSGQVAFEEEGARVKPVEAFDTKPSENGIKAASAQLVFDQLNSFSDQKVIRQRHQVRIVPVTKVTYEWKGKLYHYHIYGYENKIHLPDYPQKCCWGCQIM